MLALLKILLEEVLCTWISSPWRGFPQMFCMCVWRENLVLLRRQTICFFKISNKTLLLAVRLANESLWCWIYAR